MDPWTFFCGDWRLRRRIRDERARQTLRLIGEASFEPRADTDMLAHAEQGTFLINGQEIAASQTYLWRFEAGVAVLAFADGAPFIQFPLGAPRRRAVHLCGEDRYEGRLRIVGSDRFAMCWRVRGPRKDYAMASTYTRITRSQPRLRRP